ncbi:MAG: nucleotide exchange factor GrpE [Pseudonocardiaceae bacterium]|nr:nucleotide exchange factor GrpE [Pseudonocardiaceae bacterium]
MNPQQQPREESKPEEPIVVKDRRRVDPETGQVRAETKEETVEPPVAAPGEPGSVSGEGSGAATSAEQDSLRVQLEERTADVKRVQAEYANYRKRVERDRESVIAGAKASVASELLPLLDDIERADAHGDLTGAFKAVADKLVTTLEKSGLESYGEEGEPFDPSVHEAVQHATSPEVTGPTVTAVLRRGYRIGDRVLRPAMVAVTDHEPAEPGAAAEDVGATDATGPIPTPDAAAGAGAGAGADADAEQGTGWFEPAQPGTDSGNSDDNQR